MKKLLMILTLALPLISVASTAPGAAPTDTLTQKEKMAQQLIESVNELSKTASKLSETVNIILSSEGSEPRKETNKREGISTEKARNLEQVPTEQDILRLLNADPATRLQPQASEGESLARPYLGSDYYDNGDEGMDIDPLKQPFPFLGIPGDGKEEAKGNYLWVPDSLQEQVQALLEGKGRLSKRTEISGNPETQRVIFRGDTLNMVIRERNFGRFDRKLFNYLAVPKGMWAASLTASYGEISTDNLEMLSVLSDVNISGHIFSIKPAIHYFIRDNIALGARLSYTEGKAGIETFSVDMDEDLNFALKDVSYHTESYQAAITLTRYLGLSPRSRFSLTNEVELGFASGNSDFRRPYGGVVKETHSTTMKASLTYSPGVSVLMMKNVSFDLSFGAFGLFLKSERQTTDGVKGGTRTTSGANFKFNIFNINFGIGVRI